MARNILVITYWKFEDALIQTYTLPYLPLIEKAGGEGTRIQLVTLAHDISQPQISQEGSLTVLRLPSWGFGMKAAWRWILNLLFLRKYIRQNKITTLHTWCTPGGAIGWILSVMTGRELILDSFEPHAQPMVESGTWSKSGIAYRLLRWMEKKQVQRAKAVIGVVSGMKQYAEENYGVRIKNFLIKPACIDSNLFPKEKKKQPALLKELQLEDKLVCVYAGKFGGFYLEDDAFTFFRTAAEHWGDKFRVLLLSSTSKEQIQQYCRKSGLSPEYIVHRFVPHAQIPDHLGLGDFAFSAFKPVPSRLYCTPIKNGEYWAMGLPVVIPSGISEDSDLIEKADTGYILRSFTAEEYGKACSKIDELLSGDSEDLYTRVKDLAVKHRNFDLAEKAYRSIYGR